MRIAQLRATVVLVYITMCASFGHAQAGTATQGSFVPTGTMSQPRDVLSLITLTDGRVFAIGGSSIPPFLISADIYNPLTGLFTPTAPLIFPSRRDFTATRLLNGKILIVGGSNTSFPFSPFPAELYDPVAQTFELTGSPISTRGFGGLGGATATLLEDGRVLFVGGQDPQSRVTAELYDPLTGTFVEAAGQPHFNHSGNVAVLLHNGKVLIAAGGVNTFIGTPPEATAELYDPATDTFALSGNMIIPRLFVTATILLNGKVLIVGGTSFGIGGGPFLPTELYDPQSGTFTLSAQPHVVRDFGTATLLADGHALIAGGQTIQFGVPDGQGAELYDALQGIFSPIIPMVSHRAHHGATLLANGNVLIAGGFEINDLRGSAQRSASAELFIPVPQTPPVPMPTGLSAIAGDASVYLRWDPPATPVDKYVINIRNNNGDNGQITYIPTLVTSLAGTQQNTSILITKLPDNSLIQNGVTYQFNITAEVAGTLSLSSASISVIPGGFTGHLPKRPLDPILFLHGWNGSGTIDGTFANTLDFMQHTLHWRFGGQLYHLQDSLTNHVDQSGKCNLINCDDNDSVDTQGNFFTASFGSPVANYTSGTGLSHWTIEVASFVAKLKNDNILRPENHLVLVAHSNGGLAARQFLDFFPVTSQGSQLITYGTPHNGADLFTVPEYSAGALTDGGRDAGFTCIGNTVNLSPFLAQLDASVLPLNINYTAIAGVISHSVKIGTLFGKSLVTIPAERTADCQSSGWDGLVPRSSAEFTDAPAGSRHFYTSLFHSGQGNDFPTILCSLNPACIQVNVFSPVDIQVTAPNGQTIAQNATGIPGASYDTIDDAPGHQTSSVLIPFPQGGNYIISAVPKPGTLPSDKFTITVSQNGSITTIADNVMIKDISPNGYQAIINSFPVADAGVDQTLECSVPNGAIANLNGSHSSDADGDALTFEWKDENGNLVGSAATVSTFVPLGTHSFSLTVRDGRGGFDSARVVVVVRDTTPPLLNVVLTPSVLWPPNHRFIPVTASLQAGDTCDIAPAIKLISIANNEFPLSLGSGHTDPDISGAVFGADVRSFALRAERSGDGSGRVYTVTYEAEDRSGNKSTKTAIVTVPHNQ